MKDSQTSALFCTAFFPLPSNKVNECRGTCKIISKVIVIFHTTVVY
uniref:Uncharacterized protein n=1 Tax=Anguilla anguilla TaxID=7936 RepID=A0A0E9WZX1_ANGAN